MVKQLIIPQCVLTRMPKELSPNTKSNRWTFTAYNYDPVNTGYHIKDWMDLLFRSGNVTYIVMGEEVCPSTGRPHLQGYLELGGGVNANTRKKMQTMKGLGKVVSKNPLFIAWVKTWAWYIPNGTPLENYLYCTKTRPARTSSKGAHIAADEPNAVVYEKGIRMAPTNVIGSSERKATHNASGIQGMRTDLDLVKDAIASGDIVDYDSMWATKGLSCQASAMGLAHLARMQPKSKGMPVVIVCHGPTGTGKSYFADQISERLFDAFGWRTYLCGMSSKWFCGYDRHEIAVIDDIRPERWDFALLLRLLDRKPVNVEVKGGRTWWCPRVVIITAPTPHNQWYDLKYTDGNIAQLTRRVNENPHGGEFFIDNLDSCMGRTALSTKIDQLLVDPLYIPAPRVSEVGGESPGPGDGRVTRYASLDSDNEGDAGVEWVEPGSPPDIPSPLRGSYVRGFGVPSSPVQAQAHSPVFSLSGGRNRDEDDELADWFLEMEQELAQDATAIV